MTAKPDPWIVPTILRYWERVDEELRDTTELTSSFLPLCSALRLRVTGRDPEVSMARGQEMDEYGMLQQI